MLTGLAIYGAQMVVYPSSREASGSATNEILSKSQKTLSLMGFHTMLGSNIKFLFSVCL